MSLQGKRIFIVEDNLKNRIVYSVIMKLQKAIYEFDRWGDDTLFYLQGFKPDLIVLDLMLAAGATGYDIFAIIRQAPEYQDVPIVAISASDPAFALPMCQEKGFSGFIAKPIDDKQLPQQLAQLMQGEQVWYVGERYGGEVEKHKP